MSVMERNALDTAQVLMKAYEIGDLINCSAEVADYLYWKTRKDADPNVSALVKTLDRKKVLYEECQRFGQYHPDYQNALDAVKKVEEELEQLEVVQQFKEAEDRLDDLLYTISKTVAYSVSETIKVPSNNPLPSDGGCASGGGCSGHCG